MYIYIYIYVYVYTHIDIIAISYYNILTLSFCWYIIAMLAITVYWLCIDIIAIIVD